MCLMEERRSKVSIITVNFNTPHLTEALIQSIDASNNYPNIEILVVDNGSHIDYLPGWISKYPHVRFIRSETNLGFAGANNIAIKQATGDFFFLVNNDTEFTENLVDQLVSTLKGNSKVGIVSPKICYFDNPNIIQFAGFRELDFYLMRDSCIGEGEKDTGQFDGKAYPVGTAHGAAMMMKKETVDICGLMDENYFLFYEETDWCYRMKRKGFEIWVNADALIYHKESMSVGKHSALKEYFMSRNRILFIRKNGTFLQKIVFYTYYMAVLIPRSVVNNLRFKNYHFLPLSFRALWWNLTHGTEDHDLGFKLP